MGVSKSTPTGTPGSSAIPTSSQSKGTRGRIKRRMVQNVLLIWLDNNIDDHNTDCRNTLAQLRRVVNTINTYTDSEQCIEFLQATKNDKVCMIISSSLGQHILPRVHDMAQVDSIFIFCGDKQPHKQWAKEWPKIKGIFTEIAPICEALRKAVQQCEQDAMPISFTATDGDLSEKKLDQLEPTFMYTLILKEILLDITSEPQHFKQFIQHCHEALADNDKELTIVKRFEGHYRDETPIWWYTYPCFLYTMLNRALRLMDAEMIILMDFFISDLHRHIEQLHKQQFPDHHKGEIFTVYRGQGLSTVDFAHLSKTKGGLISFNSFLTASKNPKVSLGFAQDAKTKLEMVGVLFVMMIDSANSTTPFVSLTGVSYYEDSQDEVLFSMHTVFRIRDITPLPGNPRLFQVFLTLIDEDDEDLRVLTDCIREETNPDDHGWFRLGCLLLQMNQPSKAQEVYEILLEQNTDESEKGRIYHKLGRTHDRQGFYKEAIIFYAKSLTIQQQSFPSNHPDLATSYNNIGLMYSKMGNYAKALSHYEKALAIWQQSLPQDQLDLATSYNNIGTVDDNIGDYAKALSFHEKALAIRQQSLPSDDPDLATSYNNIGSVYSKTGDYAKALSYYQKALAIWQYSLPQDHPNLAISYNNIGLMYSKIGDYGKAVSSYKTALTIWQHSLSQDHPDLAISYNNIGSVYENMGGYPKALSSYEKALAIQQQSLPRNHPDLAISYNNIGSVYDNMGDYSKALSSYERALAIWQQAHPHGHPDLAISYNNIGSVYSKMGDYAKALSYYEKALAINQKSLPPNHPRSGSSYSNIGFVYSNMGDYAKAISYYEKALTIEEQSLPSNNASLATFYNNIGLVYSNVGDYAKALSYSNKALAIHHNHSLRITLI